MTAYRPDPIDTSRVSLSPELAQLLERLSRDTHEVWAKKRFEDGWTYGAARSDEGKTHPCLVPYDRLPEAEKDYDRAIVAQVLKAVVALGYRIEK